VGTGAGKPTENATPLELDKFILLKRIEMDMHTTRWVFAVLVVVATLGSPGVGTAAADGECPFPITRTDATGTDVTISEDPDEVVTLNPSAAQTMYEIDAWDDVVGVSTYADYLPGADERTTVGAGNDDATVERTVALDPDLVLAPNIIRDSTVEQFRRAGLTVYKFESAATLDDVVEKTRLTGELVGSCDGADERADTMERRIGIVEDAVADVARPRVLYEFFGVTVEEGAFIHDIIETAGGNNVAADYAELNNGTLGGGYFYINSEAVVDADPEWVLLSSDEYDTATVPSEAAYEGTTAAEEGNAVLLDADLVSQPAPRSVDVVLRLVRIFHPGVYETEIEDELDAGALDAERGTTVDRLPDGTTSLQATNLGRTRRVGFDLPARPNATAQVRRVNVTLSTLNPTFELRLRDGGNRSAPNGTRALDSVRLSGNGIFPRDVDYMTLRMTVNRSRLGDADPDTVTLYRANGTDWTPLRTTRVNATNASDAYVYEARTTGFSTLLLAVDDPAEATDRSANVTPTGTATATATATAIPETPTPRATTDAPATTTPTSTPGSAPGFGIIAALVALTLTAAAGVRR
jgi:putative ABC transporter PGF-CTERM-modified substrate-binding protein